MKNIMNQAKQHFLLMLILGIGINTFSQNVGDLAKYNSGNQWGDIFDVSILEIKDTMYFVHLEGYGDINNTWVGKSRLKFTAASNYVPAVGETIKAFSKSDNAWYDASVKEVKPGQVFVHYSGYDSQYDEWVSIDKTQKICPALEYINNHTKLVPDAFTMVDKSKRTNEKILKVVVYDNDWTYIRNGYGVITSRTIKGKAIGQNTANNLCYEIDILFSQENTGGSNYATTQFSRSESTKLFSADCMNK